jgi:hypothetical protein
MPRKRPLRDPNHLSDRELLREVFPERVIKRVDEELSPYRDDDDKPQTPTETG